MEGLTAFCNKKNRIMSVVVPLRGVLAEKNRMPLLQYPAAARFALTGLACARRCAHWVVRRRCSPPPDNVLVLEA